MSKQFYVKRGIKIRGPFSWDEIRSRIKSGKIVGTDKVCNEAEKEWEEKEWESVSNHFSFQLISFDDLSAKPSHSKEVPKEKTVECLCPYCNNLMVPFLVERPFNCPLCQEPVKVFEQELIGARRTGRRVMAVPHVGPADSCSLHELDSGEENPVPVPVPVPGTSLKRLQCPGKYSALQLLAVLCSIAWIVVAVIYWKIVAATLAIVIAVALLLMTLYGTALYARASSGSEERMSGGAITVAGCIGLLTFLMAVGQFLPHFTSSQPSRNFGGPSRYDDTEYSKDKVYDWTDPEFRIPLDHPAYLNANKAKQRDIQIYNTLRADGLSHQQALFGLMISMPE
jgi:hypothetical protein